MKTVSRILAAAVLLVVLLAVLSSAGLHFFLRTDRGGEMALSALNSLIPGRIRAEDISLSLLGQSATLAGAELLGPDGGLILASEEARVEIDYFSLLRDRLVFNVISLKSPRVRLAVSGDGSRLNLVQAFAREPSEKAPAPRARNGGGFAVIIGRLSVESGLIRYTDPSVGIDARLENVNARVSLDLERLEGDIEGAVARAFVRSGGRSFDLTGVKIEGAYEDGSLDPLFLVAGLGGFRASVRGRATNLFERPEVDLALEYGGEISGVAPLLDPDREYAGRVSGRAAVRGDIGNPAASASLKYEGGTVAGVPVERLTLKASLNDRVVQIQEMLLGIASGRVTAGGTINLAQAFPDGFIESGLDLAEVSYEIDFTLAGIDTARLLPGGGAYPDSVSGRIDLAGRGVLPPDIAARVDYALTVKGGLPGSPVTAGGVRVEGMAGLDYPVLTYEARGGIAGKADADIQGWMDVVTDKIQAAVSVNIRQVERIAAPFDLAVRGAVSARAEITGTLDDPTAAGTLEGTGLSWQDFLIGRVSADLRLDDTGMLRLTGLTVNEAGPSLSAKGEVKVFREGLTPEADMPVSLDVRLVSARIDRLVVQEGMGGVIQGSVHAGGTLGSPTLSVDLAGRDVVVRGASLGGIRIRGGLAGSPPAEKGRFDARLDFEITGEGMELQGLTSLAEGSLRYRARLLGSLADPRGTFRVNGADVVLAGQAVQEVTVSGELRGWRVHVPSFTAVVRDRQVVTGSGVMDLVDGYAYEFALSTGGIALGALTSFQGSQVTGGSLVFDVSGSGTLENPQLKGTVRIVDPVVRGEVLGDIAVGFEMARGVVDITGQNDFAFRGVYNLDQKAVDIQAYFEETELAPYFAVAGRPELRGTLSGSAEITGTIAGIENLDVSMHIAALSIGFGQRELVRATDLVVRYERGSLIVPESRIDLLQKGSMTIRADAAPRGRLDASAWGTLPLEVAALFDPDLAQLTGNARFDVSASGPILTPRIEGELSIEDGSYPISYNGQLLHDINGHVTFSGESVIVDSLAGRLDQGYFSARGRMDLEDLAPGRIDLRAQVRSLPVIIPETMDLVVEGQATLTGMPDKSLLQADVTILDALYYREHQLNIVAEVGQRILGGERRAQTAPEPVDLPYLRNAQLDVSVSRRGSVLVENNLAEVSIAPDLQVTGTLNAPIVTGRLAVVEGSITYQRRTFDITQGVLEFVDPYRTRAVIDLQAEGEVREWTVYLSVSGPLDNLDIGLRSDPALEDAAILSLLATGRTPDELTGTEAVAPRNPSSMLAELLASTYGEELRGATGLDILELETVSPEAGTEAGDIRITVGEELTRRLTVKYSLETAGGEMTRTAIAEYKFFENLLINGFQDNKGAFGADLQFRIEFR